MKKAHLRILGIIAAGIFLAYTLAGFFLVPLMGEKFLLEGIQNSLNRRAALSSFSFNPFTLEARLGGFVVSDLSGNREKGARPLFTVSSVYLNLSMASLFRLAPVVTQLDLDRPEFSLVLGPDGTTNISDMFKQGTGGPKEPAGAGPRFRLSNLRIKDGAFLFLDQIRGQKQVIDRINLDLPLLTALTGELDQEARPDLKFTVNGAKIQINGAGLPFDPTRKSKASLKATGIDLSAYASYVNLPPGILAKSLGRMDLELSATYAMTGALSGQASGRASDPTLSARAGLVLKNVDIRTGDDAPLASCARISIAAEADDLLSKEIRIGKLEGDQVRINLERDGQGRINLVSLFAPPQSEEQLENSGQNQANTRAEDTPSGGAVTPPPGAGQTGSSLSLPFSLTMARGSLKNTYIRFADHSVTPSFSTEISPLDLEIEDLAAGPGGVTGAYTLSFLSEARENLESRGRFSAKGELSLESTLSVRGIRPDKYRPYYGAWIGPGLSLGRADLETGVHLVLAHGAPRVKIRDGRLGLADIRITETAQNADILSVKGITASGIQGDSDQKRLRLKALVARDGHMNLERDKTGGLNILKALAIMPGPGSKELPDPASPGDAGGPWTLNLERFSLENHGLDFLDRQPGEPVRLAASDIRVTAEGLSTLPSENHGRIQAAMTLGEKGKIGIAGDIGLTRSGAALNLDLNLEKIDITPFKPYIPDHVRLGITQGHIRSKGQVALSVKPDQLPKIQFTGRAALNEFVSRVDETDFFTCRSLSLEGMDVSVFPARIHIKEVALTDFFQKAVFSPSGGFNIGRAFAPQEAGGPKKGGDPGEAGGSGKSGPPELDIGAVTLQGGRIHFADYYHAPKFTADMTEISGSIEALSSLPGKGPARLSLKGTYGSQAPLDISGTLDPFKPQPEMDLALSFKNIELVNFTPYAEKYLGYGIEKGKLVLDLKYNIREGRLTSRNHLFFDQFTLGAGVESPDATNLPVPLAISLLKNTRDEIDLDLPIQGNLTDPEFSYGSVVGNAFTNLILGVVTAPFKFLGGIVGLGDSMDLGHVAFSPGQDILIPSEKEKIDHLARILTEKDGLKLEIIGTYHSLRDGEGLQVEKFKRQLARMASGSTGGPTDRILEDLTPEARDRLVAAAWAAADFPKPKLPSGREKKLTIQEKETLLITAAEVDEGELKALALRRSRNIRDYMVGSGKIDPHRIFINDPDPAQDTPGPGVNTLFVLK